ncbi:4-diphosphocytidyl-2-C-methyl-D-erythritol kinase [Propionigenium maris DSM 9537]|uniref:4-diphosphocytidyl-2-C-methyl-D-erythritol kinase n=1 Tax=Propionigenium maris DSM 9537 TaxID=1123000 RepID=A0A9W6GQC9_9FUSO|nr:4-(cytidine 5'-diphospho)-2-C-methyl-D-erythritol kinase [Propionigenium maris]GLI58266.1 4-diphosphocytidyl-2-C-methyl-D-erythritol kinase [Propionigenium maris DSM 9537]
MKRIEANAKINIGLNILEKLPSGYHSLDMVMAPISLADEIEVEYTGRRGEGADLIITTNKSDIPTGEGNILYKVYRAYYEKTNLPREEIRVHLIKKIPHEAGLGGGSSDGGAFLRELNKYHNNLLSLEEMVDLSKGIGADIPFFLINRCCRAKGIGEKLEVVENNLECEVILVKPRFGVSAGEAYANFSRLKKPKAAGIEKILTGLKENNISNVLCSIENHLEQGLILTNGDINEFKDRLLTVSDMKFFMSGSGSTYFTLVKRNIAQETYKTLKNLFKDCEVYLCNFL